MALVGRLCPTISAFAGSAEQLHMPGGRLAETPRSQPLLECLPPLRRRCWCAVPHLDLCLPMPAAGLTFIKGGPVAIPNKAGPTVVEFWATW